jgi:hypothetical protein
MHAIQTGKQGKASSKRQRLPQDRHRAGNTHSPAQYTPAGCTATAALWPRLKTPGPPNALGEQPSSWPNQKPGPAPTPGSTHTNTKHTHQSRARGTTALQRPALGRPVGPRTNGTTKQPTNSQDSLPAGSMSLSLATSSTKLSVRLPPCQAAAALRLQVSVGRFHEHQTTRRRFPEHKTSRRHSHPRPSTRHHQLADHC